MADRCGADCGVFTWRKSQDCVQSRRPPCRAPSNHQHGPPGTAQRSEAPSCLCLFLSNNPSGVLPTPLPPSPLCTHGDDTDSTRPAFSCLCLHRRRPSPPYKSLMPPRRGHHGEPSARPPCPAPAPLPAANPSRCSPAAPPPPACLQH